MEVFGAIIQLTMGFTYKLLFEGGESSGLLLNSRKLNIKSPWQPDPPVPYFTLGYNQLNRNPTTSQEKF